MSSTFIIELIFFFVSVFEQNKVLQRKEKENEIDNRKQGQISKIMQFLFASAGVRWQQLIVIQMLVMLNVTKVFSDNDDRTVVKQPYNSDSHSEPNSNEKDPSYEEFFIEHNVSQKDAIKSFKDIGHKLLLSSEWRWRSETQIKWFPFNALPFIHRFSCRHACAFLVCDNALHGKGHGILSRWLNAAGSLLLRFTTQKRYVWLPYSNLVNYETKKKRVFPTPFRHLNDNAPLESIRDTLNECVNVREVNMKKLKSNDWTMNLLLDQV